MNSLEFEEYIVDNFDKALSNSWIKIFYQPIMRVRSDKLCGLEALARWEDPKYGLLIPDDFLHILEKYGMVHELDSFAVLEVCKLLRDRLKNDQAVVPISINLSEKDFELCDIFDIVDSIITKYEISKEFINVEVTESAFARDSEKLREGIEKFRDSGYQLWVDDFGSHSSLNVLADYDFYGMKIDVEFIRDFTKKAVSIIKSVVSMAKGIGIQTLAEGVETEKELDFLKSIGFEKIQGDIYGKPLPLSQCMEELDEKGVVIETPNESGVFGGYEPDKMTYTVERDAADVEKIKQLNIRWKQLYNIYNGVYLLDLEEDTFEVLYGVSENGEAIKGSISEIVSEHADRFVFAEDCKHYLKFFEAHTLEQKINGSERGFINAYIRTKTPHGDYTWKIYLALMTAPQQALVFVRNADSIKANAWSEYYRNYTDTARGDLGMELTKDLLWDNLNRNSHLGIFWKDKQRRFVGANQKFMDYYGFRTPADFVGKTDEDMGWHIESEPYRKDEYRVLREGAVTRRVQGHCIAHGSIRDILASKMPVYDNGRIIGLVGYFEDITESEQDRARKVDLQETDNLTGLLNVRGMITATATYKDEYERRGTDFVEVFFSLDNFEELKNLHGHAFGDEILYACGKKLANGFGTSATLVRYSGCDFMAFSQYSNPRDVEAFAAKVRRLVSEIHNVNGYNCTLYPSLGTVRFSEVRDLDKMHKLGMERMAEEREQHKRGMS
ncbi:PAS domain S-box/diguanylate cyclase (GGDEF) domain-containing protein [Lachnospiraceae bacterium JC7]|nr:PAS domain S-box/diguanylate cyclase (GGDEF) domain-containing protein [Lachnospiraceae bacterium JC7]